MIDAVSWISSRLSPTGTQAVGSLGNVQRATETVGAAGAPSFGQVFEQVAREAVESVRGAEVASVAGLQGQASTLEVVEAIRSAEQALQTATAVRDKIVQAYQEVSRMAI